MDTIELKRATISDKEVLVDIDFRLDEIEHVEQRRAEKIVQAIVNGQCFIIEADEKEVGFMLFDYRFFDQGWIELIIIDEEHRGKGIATKAMELICKESKTNKVFTSTNKSNTKMQKALAKAGFSFAGEIIGLDDGDPELFYFRARKDDC